MNQTHKILLMQMGLMFERNMLFKSCKETPEIIIHTPGK
ncbi:hypothetical protein BV332_05521 [Pseudomonas syringae pv. actinidiae]|nr:hypothetical protein BV344_05509 [Pseudomonas syringae pv. actinidiae]OSR95983.1 hypothetical protein BV332_05521 [Pseudomonas syringae pv. actinidiae]